ncbi:MAG: ATP-dependent Clp protease ATP-binding subunit [Prevotella sp.]|nr:ATP-dependent Clp protease ATP-binding subunit [Prevotella sp.]
MDKYITILENLPVDILHIAQSFAIDNMSPEIEPAHLLRALLHKSAGLVDYIEVTLDDDYYYLLDWADLRVGQCDRSPYKMKGVVLSRDTCNVVKEAVQISERMGLPEVNLQCILASLATPGVGFSYEQLKTFTIRPEKIFATLQNGKSQAVSLGDNGKKGSVVASLGASNEYVISMLEEVDDSPVVGFDNEARSVVEVLARRERANVLVVGDTGVGKTSLIRSLVQRIKAAQLPVSLETLKPYELDLIALAQGVSYKGEIEDRFRQVSDDLMSMGQVLLVVENVHRLEDKQSVLNGLLPLIKKMLSKNVMQMLCTTTVDRFTKDMEKDKELMAYFEKMVIEEPSETLAVSIIDQWVDTYAQFHHISVAEDVPTEIVRLAKRYMAERRLPSSALDLLDRAMASVKISTELSEKDSLTDEDRQLNKEAVRDVVAKMTGIPMGNIQSEERQRLAGAAGILHRRVVGQSHAIKSVLDAIYESRSGLNKKGQPMGSFFFLGPTGTGKTELAKALAEFLFDDETSILRFDMSEYKEEHSVALLYGAPPGYVGYEEGGLLVNQIRQHPYSVVLFDEIEKAHRSVFDLFLQILDEGKLHDRLGRVGDFSNSLIIFTSNIGSDYIFKSFGEGKVPTHDQMLEVMQGKFRPEFLARLTEIVPFSPITTEMIDRIFDIHLSNLLKTLNEQNITLQIDDTARRYVTRVGFNAHYGARPILGIIRKEIRRPLSKLIISGDVNPGDVVTMRYDEEKKEIIWDIA